MKAAAKRQVVKCPSCDQVRVTMGEGFFRCCGEQFPIKKNRLTKLSAPEHGTRSALPARRSEPEVVAAISESVAVGAKRTRHTLEAQA